VPIEARDSNDTATKKSVTRKKSSRIENFHHNKIYPLETPQNLSLADAFAATSSHPSKPPKRRLSQEKDERNENKTPSKE
jgi:hypothetical protein